MQGAKEFSKTSKIYADEDLPYNMLPQRSMAEGSFMTTLLILGLDLPKRDIDVYRRPMFGELKIL